MTYACQPPTDPSLLPTELHESLTKGLHVAHCYLPATGQPRLELWVGEDLGIVVGQHRLVLLDAFRLDVVPGNFVNVLAASDSARVTLRRRALGSSRF